MARSKKHNIEFIKSKSTFEKYLCLNLSTQKDNLKYTCENLYSNDNQISEDKLGTRHKKMNCFRQWRSIPEVEKLVAFLS